VEEAVLSQPWNPAIRATPLYVIFKPGDNAFVGVVGGEGLEPPNLTDVNRAL
jgi:hypothetical protein